MKKIIHNDPGLNSFTFTQYFSVETQLLSSYFSEVCRVLIVAISRAIVCFLCTEGKSESILITSKSQRMSGMPTLAFKLKASEVNRAAFSRVCFPVK